jgi:hypothetical protein
VLGHGIRAARGRRASERNGGRGRSGRLTDTTGPKWSEIMLTARVGLGEGSRPSERRAQAPAWRPPRTLTWVLVSWSSGARTVEAEARTAGVSQLVIHFFYGYVLFN